MQINVIDGNAEVFNALLYPETSWSSRQYLQDQFNSISQSLTEAGQAFMQGAREIYDRVANSQAVQYAKAYMRQSNNFFDPNAIIPIDSLEGLQQASVGMQRWIMAQPDIRTLYHQQLVDGYADTYVDMHPGVVGSEHYDYRRVLDGIITEGSEEDGYDWVTTQYPDDLYKYDRELTIGEKTDILNIWDIVKLYSEARKEDPTNPHGGDMG